MWSPLGNLQNPKKGALIIVWFVGISACVGIVGGVRGLGVFGFTSISTRFWGLGFLKFSR